MKNWMINRDGEIVLIIRSGDGRRNQSLIRVASVSRSEVVKYRSNRIPMWVLQEALDSLKIDYVAHDL